MIRSYGHFDVYQCCVSAGRWGNVRQVRDAFGPTSFVVPATDAPAYERQGAASVVGTGHAHNCAMARNAALQAAWERELPCLMLDDDPTGKMEWVSEGARRVPIDFETVMRHIFCARDLHPDARLFAITHMTNAFWVGNKAHSSLSAINGGCLLVMPNDLWFDPTLPLNSDVDYGLQHIDRYGQAVRINNVFVHFGRGNTDGAGVGAYRSDELRIRTVERLMQKWPDWVSIRPSRPEHPIVRIRRRRVRL